MEHHAGSADRIRTRARNLDLVAVESNLPGEREPGVIVAGFQAPLSFLNAYDFRRDLLEALRSQTQAARLLVLEATGIVEIDFTAAQILRDLIRRCHADGVDFAIARLESIRAQAAMARFGINELIGPDHSFRSVEEAIQALGKTSGLEARKTEPLRQSKTSP